MGGGGGPRAPGPRRPCVDRASPVPALAPQAGHFRKESLAVINLFLIAKAPMVTWLPCCEPGRQ